MPPVVLAVQTAFAAVLGKTLGIWVANAFLSTAFSVGVNMVLARKPQPASFETGTQTRLRTGSTLARQIIYGKAKTAGSLVYAVESTLTATNDKLWLVIALADHECEGLEAVYVNGRAVTLTSGVVTDYNVGSPATNYMKLRFYAGTSTQTADGALDAASTEWTSSHRGRGVCYVVLELLWNADLYDSGIPDFEFLVKGRPLYDPRLDPAQPGGSSGGHAIATESTWEFTAGGVDIGSNPALQLYDYLRGIEVGGQRIGGMKIDADTITVAEVTAAANVCEESVSLAAGGVEYRYQSGVVISTEATHRDNVQVIMAAMAGDLHDHGGRLRMFAGEARTPVLTITDDDIVRSVQYREKAEPQSWEWSKDSGRDERVNTVRGRYVAPTLLYRADEYPERTAASYLTADGGLELPGSLDLLAVQSKTQAQRLAEIYLRRSRWPGKLTFSGIPALVELESGDWVTVRSDRQGWTGGSAKTFEVESTARHPTGHVRLVLQEVDSTIFDWSTSDEGTTAAAPSNPAPTLGASWPAQFGTLAELDTIANAQVSDAAAIDYGKIEYPAQSMDIPGNGALPSTITTSLQELLRLEFTDVGLNHVFNLGGSRLLFDITNGATAACTVTWGIYAHRVAGSITGDDFQFLYGGTVDFIDPLATGNFHPDPGTGTPLPQGTLRGWSALRGATPSTFSIEGPITVATGALKWSWPLSSLYLSVWAYVSTGSATAYPSTTAGEFILKAGGLGELTNP